MSKLVEYFNEVDKNAVLRTAHQIDPIASMEKFGLSRDEQQHLLSGDMQRIAGAAGFEYVTPRTLHTPLTISVVNALNP